MNNASPDAGIPLLTEMVQPAAPVMHTDQEAAAQPDAALPAAPGQLEQQIAGRVLPQLLSSVDAMLDARIRDSLGEVLQAASAALAAEIRQALHATLGELVSAAVAQELEKQTFEKTKDI